MPIYEYHCNRCGHDFEAMQSISENSVKLCPKCNGEEVKRIISATSFQLKGTGWYATDFKDNKQKGGKKEEKEEKGKNQLSDGESSTNNTKNKEETTTSAPKEFKK